MEVFIIDGRKAMQARESIESLDYVESEGMPFESKQSSAFRFRRKTFSHVVLLNIMRRKRLLELIYDRQKVSSN